MTFDEFKMEFLKLSAACQITATPDQVAVYFEDLQHLEYETLKKSFKDVRQKETIYGRLPDIATILKYAEPKHLGEPCLDNPAFDKQAVEDIAGLVLFLRGRGKNGYDPEIGTLYYPPKQVNNNELLTQLIRVCFGGWQGFCANHQDEWAEKRLRETIMTYLKDPFYRKEAEKILGGKGGWKKSQTLLPALPAEPQKELSR